MHDGCAFDSIACGTIANSRGLTFDSLPPAAAVAVPGIASRIPYPGGKYTLLLLAAVSSADVIGRCLALVLGTSPTDGAAPVLERILCFRGRVSSLASAMYFDRGLSPSRAARRAAAAAELEGDGKHPPP